LQSERLLTLSRIHGYTCLLFFGPGLRFVGLLVGSGRRLFRLRFGLLALRLLHRAGS